MTCPLCLAADSKHVHQHIDKKYGKRDYYCCSQCQLIYLSPQQYLSPEEERSRYDLHENDPSDEGYTKFLSQLVEPLGQLLPEGARGLDYGCGPGPTLCHLLTEAGFSVENYDPIFFPEQKNLSTVYDFVTCTETVEHFYHANREWRRFKQLVKNDGWLGLMTGMYRDIPAFCDWWYHREPTHVNFYHEKTWQWIAQEWGWEIQYMTDRVIILKNKL